MKRALLVGAVLLATTTAASAGTYLGLGIGPDANVGSVSYLDSGGRSARLLGGYSFGGLKVGTLSIEGSLTGQSLAFDDSVHNPSSMNAKELGVAAKYNFPIGYHFELLAKAGVHHTWVTHERPDVYGSYFDASGSGLMIGTGVEYRVSVGPIKAGSLFLDYTYYRATLEGERQMLEDASVGMWMLGFTVGL